jgi:hypothetical protein
MASDDEPILTAREERAATALQRALRATSEEWPFRLDTSAWVAKAPKRRSIGRRLPIGLAASLAVVLLSVVAFSAWPRAAGPAASASASPTSWPGHFDNGTFSFDYPTNWRTISGLYYETMVNKVDVVLGTGDWQTGCHSWSSGDNGGEDCVGDQVDVSGGRIVVKVYQREGGPADLCGARRSPNATLSANAVLKTTEATTTTWEIRLPGGEFGWAGNVFVAAQTENAPELARVAALVESFRWAKGVSAGWCYPTASPWAALAHYDADNISFDYPAGWAIITDYQHWGLHGPTIEFAVGTGTADAGCTLLPASSTELGGVACGSPTIAATGDQVVVVWYEGAGLGIAPLPARTLAPGEARDTIGGMPAIESHGDGWIRWQVSGAGYIEGRWGPNASAGELEVRALVASLRIAPPTKVSQAP